MSPFCVCWPNANEGVFCAPPLGAAFCCPNPPNGLLLCWPKPLELGCCCGWLWPKVKAAAGAGVEFDSILSIPFPSLGCWPKVKLPVPPNAWLGCCCGCCGCCAPKLKLLGVVVNVLGGVKVVLGPVKGDADLALPPRLMLAILFLALVL